MSSTHTQDVVLSAELEAIAAAAHDRLRAEAGEDLPGAGDAQRRVAEAASAAITAGTALGAIAEAEHVGELRARAALGAETLRHLARAARRKREAEGEYEQAVKRAGRLGLPHREIAAAGEVSHGTVRVILARAIPSANGSESPAAAEGRDGVNSGAA
jgi:DNA-directed RNA polymerase specialized sigma24 family protein